MVQGTLIWSLHGLILSMTISTMDGIGGGTITIGAIMVTMAIMATMAIMDGMTLGTRHGIMAITIIIMTMLGVIMVTMVITVTVIIVIIIACGAIGLITDAASPEVVSLVQHR